MFTHLLFFSLTRFLPYHFPFVAVGGRFFLLVNSAELTSVQYQIFPDSNSVSLLSQRRGWKFSLSNDSFWSLSLSNLWLFTCCCNIHSFPFFPLSLHWKLFMYFMECQENSHKSSTSNWATQFSKAGYIFLAKYILLLSMQLARKKTKNPTTSNCYICLFILIAGILQGMHTKPNFHKELTVCSFAISNFVSWWKLSLNHRISDRKGPWKIILSSPLPEQYHLEQSTMKHI